MKLNRIDWIKKYIKLVFSVPQYPSILSNLKKHSNKRAVIIGAPIHGNLGDHLIASECLKYIEKRGFSDVVEIPEFLYELFPNRINLHEDDTIFIVGGGWMGNMYEDELVIESVIERWGKNRIVILSQTVFFEKNGKYSSVNQCKKCLGSANNLILCVRENNSYLVCKNILEFDNNRVLLLPDMALLGMKSIQVNRNKNSKKIIFSIRKDLESIDTSSKIIEIKEVLLKNGYDCVESSSVSRKKIIVLNSREKEIQRKKKEFSNASLIITDRLHSMVFALLAGVPCIALDNSTHKVSGVYDTWLYDVPGLKVCGKIEMLNSELIFKMLKSKEVPIAKDFTVEFNRLNEIIEGYSVNGQ